MRVHSQLTILWTTLAHGEIDAVKHVVRAHEADLVSVNASSLWTHVTPALIQGAVVAIVADDAEASSALAMGVDEVVRAGELTRETLERAISRAEVRARVRTTQADGSALAQDTDCGIFDLLAGATSHELSTRLMTASLDFEVLTEGLTGLHDANQMLAGLAARNSPERERVRIAAISDRAPMIHVGTAIEGVRSSLQEASAAVRSLNELTRGHGNTDAGSLLRDLAHLLRHHLSPCADIRVESLQTANLGLRRPEFVCIAAALIANAVDSVRLSGVRGTIVLRLSEEDGTVVFEVSDNGLPIDAHVTPKGFEPLFRAARGRGAKSALLGIRERVRSAGGELLIDADEGGSCVRVYLPVTSAPVVDFSTHQMVGWSQHSKNVS